MDDLLLSLGRVTLGGSAAVLLLWLAGKLTHGRYGSRWRCWAWLLLSLRLMVPLPLLPASAPAPITLPAPPEAVLNQPLPRPSGANASPAAPQGPQAPALSGGERPQSAPRPQAEPAPAPIPVLAAVWLAGAAGTLLWSLFSHLRLALWLRRWAQPVTDGETVRVYNELGDALSLDSRPRLLACPGLRGPMLAGLLRPALLLPREGGPELRYALLHELTHYRRHDVWLKAAAVLAGCVHWFNPLVWWMARLTERDMELACDEAALASLPREEYAAYGQAILEAARGVPFSCKKKEPKKNFLHCLARKSRHKERCAKLRFASERKQDREWNGDKDEKDTDLTFLYPPLRPRPGYGGAAAESVPIEENAPDPAGGPPADHSGGLRRAGVLPDGGGGEPGPLRPLGERPGVRLFRPRALPARAGGVC